MNRRPAARARRTLGPAPLPQRRLKLAPNPLRPPPVRNRKLAGHPIRRGLTTAFEQRTVIPRPELKLARKLAADLVELVVHFVGLPPPHQPHTTLEQVNRC